MLQLACSWLGRLVVGLHVRDAGGCMEEKLKDHPSVEIFTEGSAGGWEHGWGALECMFVGDAYATSLVIDIGTGSSADAPL